MDSFVGRKLKELEEAGLDDSTIVFFFGDHGCGLPRGKRWLYESGLHVPMLVHIPQRFSRRFESIYQPGASSDRLVAFVDLLPTVLDLCQLPIPENLHGRSFFVPESLANQYNYGFRDRMDERVDSSRAIRNDRYLYIRNFIPDRPQGAYLSYMFQTPTTQDWRRLFDENKLSDVQRAFWLPKATEELYDIQEDPFQIHNIARNPQLQSVRMELADALKSKMHELLDTGSIPEDWIWQEQKQNMQVAIDAAWNSDQAQRDTETLLTMLQSAQVIERYWGAVAFRGAGATVKDQRIIQLAIGLLNDPSLDVRAVVAEALVRYAEEPQQRNHAMQVLLGIPTQSSARWGARMIALNALCDLGISEQQADPIKQAYKRDGKSWNESLPNRYSEYLGRLISQLGSTE